MKGSNYKILQDQIIVHLLIFGCFQIPCKEYFSLSGNALMKTICGALLGLVVVALIIRILRMNKNLLNPFEENKWKSPLYPALASLCVSVLGDTWAYYAVSLLFAAWTFYLLFKTIRMLYKRQLL